MQLAGKDCIICQRDIVMDADATWCGACRGIFHRKCLAQAQIICPTCGRTAQNPVELFVYSQVCPECFTPNRRAQAKCECGARMQWDSHKEYDDFVAFMKDEARMQFIRGVAQLLGAGLCLLALVAVWFGLMLPAIILFVCLTGFFILTLSGIGEILTSIDAHKFR